MDLEQSRQVLLDQSRSKKNGEFPKRSTHEGELRNPICGDRVDLKLRIESGVITEAGFKAEACAICSASAALLTASIQQKPVQKMIEMTQEFEKNILLTPETAWPETLNNFQVFEHLKVNPSRKTCALLPFVALRSILKKV
jgi:nitrogen fixation NifU-like protein